MPVGPFFFGARVASSEVDPPASNRLPHRMLGRLLRFFFQHIYHDLAFAYDSVAAAVSLGRWQTWIEAVLPFINGRRILELGHGTGRLLEALAGRESSRAFGLDESSEMAMLARRRTMKSGTAPAGLIRGLAQRLPLSTASFDCIVSTFPTEFIYDQETLSEIHRVLRPGGCLIVLPVAWIVGRKQVERAAAWLFVVTRQTPPAVELTIGTRLERPLLNAGFQVAIHRIEVHASIVLVVVATR
ncbi:MAG: methyltransferase domain-containing protein [Chloroflexota bacterium]